jgi:hypothetical protein
MIRPPAPIGMPGRRQPVDPRPSRRNHPRRPPRLAAGRPATRRLPRSRPPRSAEAPDEWVPAGCLSALESFVRNRDHIRHPRHAIANSIALRITNARLEAMNGTGPAPQHRARGFRRLESLLACSATRVNARRAASSPMLGPLIDNWCYGVPSQTAEGQATMNPGFRSDTLGAKATNSAASTAAAVCGHAAQYDPGAASDDPARGLMDVAVIVVGFNDATWLAPCLQSLVNAIPPVNTWHKRSRETSSSAPD